MSVMGITGSLDAPSLLAFAGTVLSGLIIYATAKLTSRQARAATASATATADASTAVDGYDRLTGRLSRRLEQVELRLTDVEVQLRDSRRTLHVALAYIERLLDFVAEAVPDRDRKPPGIPSELTDHLPPSLMDDWRTPPS